jgi:hypothetical protein
VSVNKVFVSSGADKKRGKYVKNLQEEAFVVVIYDLMPNDAVRCKYLPVSVNYYKYSLVSQHLRREFFNLHQTLFIQSCEADVLDVVD